MTRRRLRLPSPVRQAESFVATRGMHPCPLSSWCLYTTDASSVHLLTDDGAPSPELSAEPARTLAALTAAIHAVACRLGEHELRHLELFIALQRWRR